MTKKAQASVLDYAVAVITINRHDIIYMIAVIINGHGIIYMIHMILNGYDMIHMIRITYHAFLFAMCDIYDDSVIH